jgi:hypothetical protein
MHADPELFYRDSLLPDKVALDLAYARSHSLWRDLVVVCQTLTLPLILLRQRARGEGEPGPALRSVAYAGFAVAVVALPVVFALGLGSPR